MFGWLRPYLVRLIGLALSLFIYGCSEDGSSEPAPTLTGFWQGSTFENVGIVQSTVVSYALFHEGMAYLLREDEIQKGFFTVKENGHSDLIMDLYPYIAPDNINFFYVGTYNNSNLPMDALQNTELDLVINYNDTNRAGRMILELDVDQQLEISLERIAGEWKTLDAQMVISPDGGFNGWNANTSCQWEGTLSLLTSDLYSLNLGRTNCTEFNIVLDEATELIPNITPDGFALIDGDGVLHFIATEDPRILWMRFDPVAVAATTDTTTDTTTP